MATPETIRESWSHPLHLRSRRGEMDVQILGVRIGELPFDSLFQHAKSRLSFRSIRAVRALERQPSKLRVAGSNPAGVANLFRRLAFERSAVSCRGLFPQFPMARGASWRGGIGAANASIGLTVYLNARLSLRIEQDR